jgi:hypothetical protein
MLNKVWETLTIVIACFATSFSFCHGDNHYVIAMDTFDR